MLANVLACNCNTLEAYLLRACSPTSCTDAQVLAAHTLNQTRLVSRGHLVYCVPKAAAVNFDTVIHATGAAHLCRLQSGRELHPKQDLCENRVKL